MMHSDDDPIAATEGHGAFETLYTKGIERLKESPNHELNIEAGTEGNDVWIDFGLDNDAEEDAVEEIGVIGLFDPNDAQRIGERIIQAAEEAQEVGE